MVSNPLSNLNDKDLMQKYQNGDQMAFQTLYFRHHKKVYSYLEKRLHDKSDLDDLFQKVFVKFHRSKHLYNEKYEVLPWLYTMTKSELLDYFKKKRLPTVELTEEILPVQESPKSQLDLDEEKDLSMKEKNVLHQRFYEDQDFVDIANRLDTSQSNVRKILSRAMIKLRKKYLGGHDEK